MSDASTPAVTLTAQYDLNGNRTALSATINWSYNDFQDRFSYDRLNRQTQITQQGVIDGNAVDVKAVGLNYDAASRLTGISRGRRSPRIRSPKRHSTTITPIGSPS